MRILFFTNEYSHPKLPSSGGVGSFLKIMSESLTAKGHEVYVYGFSKKPMEFIDDGIKFKFFKKYSKQFRIKEFVRSISTKLGSKKADLKFLIDERQFYAKKLKEYSKKHDIDIIESFVFNGFTVFFDNSIPLVLRFHGSRGFWHYYLGAKKDTDKILMEQHALEATEHLVAVSKFSARAVENIYKISPDKIIYNGIDADFFAPAKVDETINHSIFYFGTMSKAKGVDILCKVFSQVVEKFPNATLHLIGRGQDYFNHLSENILTESARKKTTYHGPKNSKDLVQLLQKANICLFPSLNENFSLAIMEAMALEKIVIASDIPAFKEIIDHNKNGMIAKNIDDYVNHISTIFSASKSYDFLAQNARKDILENYTKEKMVELTLNYYQEKLTKKS